MNEIFYLILGFTFIGIILMVFHKIKDLEHPAPLLVGGIILILSLLLLPFFDPLLINGFLASVILELAFFSFYGVIVGIGFALGEDVKDIINRLGTNLFNFLSITIFIIQGFSLFFFLRKETIESQTNELLAVKTR